MKETYIYYVALDLNVTSFYMYKVLRLLPLTYGPKRYEEPAIQVPKRNRTLEPNKSAYGVLPNIFSSPALKALFQG